MGCGEQKNETIDRKTENVNDQIETLTDSKVQKSNYTDVLERFFPEENETVEFDTIISAQNLEISIKSTTLDSYVTNEFEIQGIKHM